MTIFLHKEPGQDKIVVKFKYSSERVKLIRMIQGREYLHDKKYWTIPNQPVTIENLYKLFKNEEIIADFTLKTGLNKTKLDNDSSLQLDIDFLIVDGKELMNSELIRKVENEMKIIGYGNSTKQTYLGHIRRYLLFVTRFLTSYTITDKDPLTIEISTSNLLSHITRGNAKIYVVSLLDKDNSHSYVNQAISAINFLYKTLFPENKTTCEDIKRFPGDQTNHCGEPIKQDHITIKRPKKEKKLPSVMSFKEVSKIFQAIDNLKHKMILMIIYSGGFRVGEVVKLKVSDIAVTPV